MRTWILAAALALAYGSGPVRAEEPATPPGFHALEVRSLGLRYWAPDEGVSSCAGLDARWRCFDEPWGAWAAGPDWTPTEYDRLLVRLAITRPSQRGRPKAEVMHDYLAAGLLCEDLPSPGSGAQAWLATCRVVPARRAPGQVVFVRILGAAATGTVSGIGFRRTSASAFPNSFDQSQRPVIQHEVVQMGRR